MRAQTNAANARTAAAEKQLAARSLLATSGLSADERAAFVDLFNVSPELFQKQLAAYRGWGPMQKTAAPVPNSDELAALIERMK